MGLDHYLLINPREGGELILSMFIRVRGLEYCLLRFWRVMCYVRFRTKFDTWKGLVRTSSKPRGILGIFEKYSDRFSS